MKKILLFTSIMLFSLGSICQVPDNETFSLQNVASEITTGGATSRVDRFFKSGYPFDATVTCNGYTEILEWNTDADQTVLDFIADHSSDFGNTTLSHSGFGEFLITANVPGVDFSGESSITGTGNETEILTPNYNGTSVTNLLDCFSYADPMKFDKWFYPNYKINGPNYNVENSLLNFRNYGATLRPPIYFLPRGITETSISWYWLDNSYEEEGFYIMRSPDGVSDWVEVETTLPNIQRFNDTGLKPNTEYFYRIRAFNGANYSTWVTNSATTVPFDDTKWYLPPVEELELMLVNLDAYNVGNFSEQIYWSSSETSVGTSYAIGVSFSSSPGPIVVDKANSCSVRAAHNFTGAYGAYSLRSTGPEGGLIYYIQPQPDGTYRYYEAASSDQAVLQSWSNVTDTRCGSTYPNCGTGLHNTAVIMAQPGHTNSAAKVCDDLN